MFLTCSLQSDSLQVPGHCFSGHRMVKVRNALLDLKILWFVPMGRCLHHSGQSGHGTWIIFFPSFQGILPGNSYPSFPSPAALLTFILSSPQSSSRILPDPIWSRPRLRDQEHKITWRQNLVKKLNL